MREQLGQVQCINIVTFFRGFRNKLSAYIYIFFAIKVSLSNLDLYQQISKKALIAF